MAKGIALGAFVFARCLHHGLGVEKNVAEARMWYSKVKDSLLQTWYHLRGMMLASCFVTVVTTVARG